MMKKNEMKGIRMRVFYFVVGIIAVVTGYTSISADMIREERLKRMPRDVHTIGMRGFTLMEILVVIGLMVLLSGFVSLSADIIRKERISAAARELVADLHAARMNAMTRDGGGFGIRFESAGSYSMFTFSDCNNDSSYDRDTCPGNSREEKNVMMKAMNKSVVLKKNNPGTNFNNYIVMFDRNGVPRRENGSLGMTTIVVKSDDNDEDIKCVTISLNRIRGGVWARERRSGRNTCIEQ